MHTNLAVPIQRRGAGWRTLACGLAVLGVVTVLSVAPQPGWVENKSGSVRHIAEKYASSSIVTLHGVTMEDVPSMVPSHSLAHIRMRCHMRIYIPLVGASITVSAEDMQLYFEGVAVGTLQFVNLDVARGGAEVDATADVVLAVSNHSAAAEMGAAAMFRKKFSVQMAGTIRAKVLGKNNGCVLGGSRCVDGWIPRVRLANVRPIAYV